MNFVQERIGDANTSLALLLIIVGFVLFIIYLIVKGRQ